MKTYITYSTWRAKGTELFGKNILKWRFVCPVCKRVFQGEEFLLAGLKNIGFKCPFTKTKLCDYGENVVYAPNPWIVTFPNGDQMHMFAFDGCERIDEEDQKLAIDYRHRGQLHQLISINKKKGITNDE